MLALEADLAAAQALGPDEPEPALTPSVEAQAPPPDGASDDLHAHAKALAASDSLWRPAVSGCGGVGLAVALGVGAGLAPVVGAPALGGLACGALGCATTAWGWDLDPRPLPEGACVSLDEADCAALGEAYGDAVLRRRHPLRDQPCLDHPPYFFDLETRRCRLDGREVMLTDKEFELAVFLFQHLGRIFSRGHLLDAVWRGQHTQSTRTIDTHISRLRRKLQLTDAQG
ncbi:winged helix-turn-helix domain-containing protein, partial [Myxococcota bacterium]|nr:winged helix-turn-helix domain-containing protein [Myxococcota bacterium]